MKLFVVDARRSDRGNYGIVQVVDVSGGKLISKTIGRNSHYSDLPFSCLANELIGLVLKEKPDKIVFDELGLGMGLRDSFCQEIKNVSSSVSYAEFNGSLMYA